MTGFEPTTFCHGESHRTFAMIVADLKTVAAYL